MLLRAYVRGLCIAQTQWKNARKKTAASTVDTHTGYICISLNPRKRVHSFADSSVSDGRSYSSTHRLYITKPKGEGNACILLQAAVLLMADNLSLSHKRTHTQVPSHLTCINTKHIHKTHPFKHITTTTPNTHTSRSWDTSNYVDRSASTLKRLSLTDLTLIVTFTHHGQLLL